MTLDGEMTKTKVVDLEKSRNCFFMFLFLGDAIREGYFTLFAAFH
jgi:hypothetical protein